ncbi:MAG TPA: metal-dependent hydrolase [Polyangiaceae bacterium]|jgi:membrane-bound metal-dependent hydrolase YbcI (DUF457 family)
MFIGHFAVGFASKRLAPRTSLVWLVLAPIFADVLWPVFVLAGMEQVRIDPGNTAVTPLDFVSYPWSHSLLMLTVWGALFGAVYVLCTHDRRAALILAAGVVSHWVLDFVTHRPDLPLYPGGGPRVGLSLWSSIPATIAVESVLFAAGLALYFGATRAKNRKGTLGCWAFIVLLLFIYTANLFGPPPPSPNAIAIAGLLANLLLLWVWWFDRNREAS